MSTISIRRRIALAVRSKLARIRRGERPRVLDLFSGCGGISLGFERAGCLVVGGIERDADAAASFRWNFRDKRKTQPPAWLSEWAHDITKTEPAVLARNAGCKIGSVVDILVGGPPCQAFARIGRAKLRSVTEDPEAWLNDPRADLYRSYLRYVRDFAPCAIFMENVPDFLSHGGVNVADEVCANLESLGYEPRYTLMNSSYYGVPQHRERMFLVAIHKTARAVPVFPAPTNASNLPAGYKGTRASALAGMKEGKSSRYLATPPDEIRSDSGVQDGAVSVSQAIGDIPPIPPKMIGPRFSRIPRNWAYRIGRSSRYAQEMRNWPGHTSTSVISDHLTRWLPRDFPIFARMQQGEEYPAMHARQSKLRDRVAKANGIRKGSREWKRLTKELIPPYPVDKFPNKWHRLMADEPSRTLLAHLGKDGYTHIHPSESRVISVREAARLQSFPDGFCFKGSMNAMFRQIGNSVPPLMVVELARALIASMRKR